MFSAFALATNKFCRSLCKVASVFINLKVLDILLAEVASVLYLQIRFDISHMCKDVKS